eukprot:8299760-Prorocentrum_lima.AAC.1
MAGSNLRDICNIGYHKQSSHIWGQSCLYTRTNATNCVPLEGHVPYPQEQQQLPRHQLKLLQVNQLPGQNRDVIKFLHHHNQLEVLKHRPIQDFSKEVFNRFNK